MIKYAVLAGNMHQFRSWQQETMTPRYEAVYVHNQTSLCGLPYGIKFVKYGTWYERDIDLRDAFEYEAKRKGEPEP